MWVEHRHSAAFSHATERSKRRRKKTFNNIWQIYDGAHLTLSDRNGIHLSSFIHTMTTTSAKSFEHQFFGFFFCYSQILCRCFFCGSYILIAHNQSPETMAKSKFQQLKNNQINSQFAIQIPIHVNWTHHSKINCIIIHPWEMLIEIFLYHTHRVCLLRVCQMPTKFA